MARNPTQKRQNSSDKKKRALRSATVGDHARHQTLPHTPTPMLHLCCGSASPVKSSSRLVQRTATLPLLKPPPPLGNVDSMCIRQESGTGLQARSHSCRRTCCNCLLSGCGALTLHKELYCGLDPFMTTATKYSQRHAKQTSAR